MSERAPFQGFVGSAFGAQCKRLDVQDLWNWYVERSQSPYAKSGQAFLPCPGFQTFVVLPTSPVRGLFAINDRTFAVGGEVLYELTRTGGSIARPTSTVAAPAAPVITTSKLAVALPATKAPVVTHGGDLGTTTYSYKVTATNTYGETAASPEGTSTLGNVTLSGSNWNIVSWTDVEGATGYKLYRTAGGTAPPQLVATLKSTTLVFNDIGDTSTSATPPTTDTSGQPAGTTTYGYKVTAILGIGETEASAEGTTTTGQAKLTSTDYNVITWSEVVGARGYKVYRTTGIVGTALIPPPRLIATITEPALAKTKDDATKLETRDTGQEGEAVEPPTTNTTGTKVVVDNGAPVSWATSGDAGNELFVVSGGFAYCYDLETNQFAPVVKGATFAGFIDSYFVTLDAGTSTLKVSESFDGFNWDPTQLYQRSRAGDKWLAMAVTSNYIWLIGSQTGEVWTGTGNADTRFAPYQPVFLETGIVAPATMTRCSGDTMMWVAQDKDGAGYVVRVNGYNPEKVSTTAVDFSIQNLVVIADGFAFSYQQEGHTHEVITFPNDETTWVYDLSTNEWHRRGDWDPDAMVFKAYRPSCHAFAFGGGGHGFNLVGDRSSGTIAKMHPSYTTDMDGSVIRRMRDCPVIADRDQEMTFDRLQIDCEVGLGLATGQGSDPTMMVSYSNNNAKTWGHELWKHAGKQGDYRIQVAWTRLGTGKQRVFRLVVTDPIPWRIVGAWLEMEGS